MSYEQRAVAVTVAIVCITALISLPFIPKSPVIRNARVRKASRSSATNSRLVLRGDEYFEKANNSPEMRDARRLFAPTDDSSVAQIQRERQKLLKEGCREYHLYNAPLSNLETISVNTTNKLLLCHEYHLYNAPLSNLETISVNTTNKLLLCRVAKVASTTWAITLGIGFGGSRDIKARQVVRKYLLPMSRYGVAGRQRMAKNFNSFMFVRHPFERLISAWRDRFIEMPYRTRGQRFYGGINEGIKRRYRPLGNRTGRITFHEFVKFLIDPRTRRPFDVHWRPIHQLCRVCRIQYDFIGHYETLREDADYLLNKLRMDNVKFPHSVRKNSSSFVDKEMATLTAQQIRKLKEVYRLDFLLFGYPYEL